MAPDKTRSPILSCMPGSLNPFALKLKSSDTIGTIQSRAARKLALPGDGKDIEIKYLYCDVLYTLEDDDDWEVFLDRLGSAHEIVLLLSGPSIPTSNPSIASISSLPASSAFSAASTSSRSPNQPQQELGAGAMQQQQQQRRQASDAQSTYSSALSYGRAEPRDIRKGTTMHLLPSSASVSGSSYKNGSSVARSVRSEDTATIDGQKKKGAKSIAPSIPEHKIKFEEFHNQLGVRTFIGSIGPVENVRMMMKAGHRACYMSRAFAQQHNFIPKDAAPGFYGFSGITNLGTWPIKVGSKTVEQQVLLVENSYFPVILGRSFMERRGVRTDPLDPTSVTFMDTNEVIATDLVVVKDAAGDVIPIS